METFMGCHKTQSAQARRYVPVYRDTASLLVSRSSWLWYAGIPGYIGGLCGKAPCVRGIQKPSRYGLLALVPG